MHINIAYSRNITCEYINWRLAGQEYKTRLLSNIRMVPEIVQDYISGMEKKLDKSRKINLVFSTRVLFLLVNYSDKTVITIIFVGNTSSFSD